MRVGGAAAHDHSPRTLPTASAARAAPSGQTRRGVLVDLVAVPDVLEIRSLVVVAWRRRLTGAIARALLSRRAPSLSGRRTARPVLRRGSLRRASRRLSERGWALASQPGLGRGARAGGAFSWSTTRVRARRGLLALLARRTGSSMSGGLGGGCRGHRPAPVGVAALVWAATPRARRGGGGAHLRRDI